MKSDITDLAEHLAKQLREALLADRLRRFLLRCQPAKATWRGSGPGRRRTTTKGRHAR